MNGPFFEDLGKCRNYLRSCHSQLKSKSATADKKVPLCQPVPCLKSEDFGPQSYKEEDKAWKMPTSDCNCPDNKSSSFVDAEGGITEASQKDSLDLLFQKKGKEDSAEMKGVTNFDENQECICPEKDCTKDLVRKPLFPFEEDDNPLSVSKQHILDILSSNIGNRGNTYNVPANSSLDISSTLSSVQSKIEELHGQEISIFNQMRSQIDNELRQHSQDVVRKMEDQKLVISSLIKENGHMRSVQEKLVKKVKELKGTLVTRSMYDACLAEKENLIKLFGDVTPIMRKLKEIFVNFKNGGMSGLITSRTNALLRLQQESGRREAVEKELEEQKSTANILSANVRKFLPNIEKLLHNYFGVKVNLKELMESKNSNFAQLSDGLGSVHDKVKELSDTFAQRIEAEETKVLFVTMLSFC